MNERLCVSYAGLDMIGGGQQVGLQSVQTCWSTTHQRNVVFVLIVALSDRITGLAVRSTHESFGSSSQETRPA